MVSQNPSKYLDTLITDGIEVNLYGSDRLRIHFCLFDRAILLRNLFPGTSENYEGLIENLYK